MKAKDLIDAVTLKLFKDSEDRAHGTPTQEVKVGSDPDNPIRHVHTIERLIVKPDERKA